ncbi:MAG: glycosyltransferase family 1 protein [Gemmatimonadaceae bacterium]
MNDQATESVLTLPPPIASAPAVAPLVVAVEATRLAREVRGIGRYVRALLPRLIALRPGLRLELYVKRQRDIDALAPGFADPVYGGRVSLHRVRSMTSSRADVFWYPWNVAAPIPSRGAVVVTMHDVVPIAHPDPRRIRGFQKNLRWRRRYATTARHATLIIADSQFTADEVHRMLGVPYERMRVVLLAADDFAVPPAAGDAEALARLGVARPFVLAVGAADRRKNLELLERAMPRVVASLPEVSLVLAGPRRDPHAAQPDASWRKPVGFVSDEELAALYRSASVLVMPSTYEGFGLPVLEAMQLGTPVISTRASSLPEVGGDAALWIDPDDDVALAERIVAVMTEPARAAAMRAASLAQSARFSWDETARRTISTFEDALAVVGR